jgi:hypothetical protein
MEAVDPHDIMLRDVEHFASSDLDPAVVRLVSICNAAHMVSVGRPLFLAPPCSYCAF